MIHTAHVPFKQCSRRQQADPSFRGLPPVRYTPHKYIRECRGGNNNSSSPSSGSNSSTGKGVRSVSESKDRQCRGRAPSIQEHSGKCDRFKASSGPRARKQNTSTPSILQIQLSRRRFSQNSLYMERRTIQA